MGEDYPISIRMNFKEKEYLEKNNITPSEFWHKSINEKIKIGNKDEKKEKLKDRLRHVVLAGVGVFLIFYSFPITNLLAFLISFFLGIFFLVTGLVDVLIELTDRLKVKRVGRTKI